MELKIHLHFQGNCQEALDFYGRVFNTSPGHIVTYGESPTDLNHPLPEGYSDKIMNTEMDIAGIKVMFSDGFPGWEAITGNHVTLAVNTKDILEANRIFDGLQEGGTVHMSLGKTFFSEAFGMLTDKFGVLWHIGVSI